MPDTFFGPQSKSEQYWQRELTAEGRAENDRLDQQEQASSFRQMEASGEATAIARGMRADLWGADAENKAFWREHLQTTGELLTPEQRHRLDERDGDETVGQQLLAALAEEYGADAVRGARIIVPRGQGTYVRRETQRAEKRREWALC